MKKVILYIATSLDGYIADKSGDISWLGGQDPAPPEETSYIDFVKNIDTIILGWNTFNQIVTELAPNDWVYKGMNTYVLTNQKETANKMLEQNVGNIQKHKGEIKFTDENIEELVNLLKKEEGKDIWICGGASIVNQLIKLNLIDIYHISIMPTILGEGIKLFDEDNKKIDLRLVSTKTYNGIVEVEYIRR